MRSTLDLNWVFVNKDLNKNRWVFVRSVDITCTKLSMGVWSHWIYQIRIYKNTNLTTFNKTYQLWKSSGLTHTPFALSQHWKSNTSVSYAFAPQLMSSVPTPTTQNCRFPTRTLPWTALLLPHTSNLYFFLISVYFLIVYYSKTPTILVSVIAECSETF